jgi:hypothetical protein
MVLLLKNIGYDIPIWSGIARYWPVLLIVWGFIKLVDYARWRKAGQPGPLFGAGEVVLLIIVILSGTALTAAANISPDFVALFENLNVDLFDITGNSYPFTQHLEKAVPSGASIEVFNRYGDVEVRPAETDQISVDVAKTIIARDEKEAKNLEEQFTYDIVEENGRYRVISNFNRDQNSVRGRRFKTSLTVKVPKSASLSINNRAGRVEVSGLTGQQNIRNSFGQVVLKNINGAVEIDNKSDAVIVEDVTGVTKITNEFGSVDVKRINGNLEVRNRNGSVQADEVKGDAKIDGSFGDISVTDIAGNLEVDDRNGSVDVLRVEKDAMVRNRFHSVKLVDVKGSVNVENENGGIEVRYSQPPKNNIQLTSKFSDITVVVPSGSSFSIDARTRYSSISTDFNELNTTKDSDRNTLTGRVGSGGPEIRINNHAGNIHIEK